jgi:hypothetical protein
MTTESSTPMRYILSLILLALIFAYPAKADTTAHADLVCDPTNNIALARFIEAEDPGPPHYARLPAALDHGLSAQSGTGRRVCNLAHGGQIKLRNGQEQAFAYGAGGAAPPDFFSLWIDARKVISRQNWSRESYDQTEDQIAGVVITPTRITTCVWKDGDDTKPLACSSKPQDLTRYKTDNVEYPANFWHGPGAERLVVVPGTDESVCRDLIQHGPNAQGVVRDSAGEPDLPVAAKDLDWIDTQARTPSLEWSTVSDWKAVFGLKAAMAPVNFPPHAMDFDGDSKPDTVVELDGSTHYFDGSFYVVAPANVAVADVLRTLFSQNTDVEHSIKKSPSPGLARLFRWQAGTLSRRIAALRASRPGRRGAGLSCRLSHQRGGRSHRHRHQAQGGRKLRHRLHHPTAALELLSGSRLPPIAKAAIPTHSEFEGVFRANPRYHACATRSSHTD